MVGKTDNVHDFDLFADMFYIKRPYSCIYVAWYGVCLMLMLLLNVKS